MLEPMADIRPATVADCAAVADIYRHYVENTVATFDLEAPPEGHWETKLATIGAAGRPFLVAVERDRVVGFAYLGDFRDKAAYDRTVEDTIYLHPDAGRRGIGSALLAALVDAADPDNVTQIVAVIAATDGEASVALHTRHGFAEVGRLLQVGHKFDTWVDCVLMQRAVG